MPYALGIDLGSGHLTAAICRNDHERWSEPEVLALDGLAVTEAVLHLTDEGTVEVGDRALRHVTTRPDRVTRGFVDRVGDEIPITLGGQPYPAEVLIAAVVGWIADYAEAAEGMPPSQLVVTHPAGWGTHRRATLLGALRDAGLPELTLLPRPVAAAESYAATERVEVGQEIAVHSLGAGRFESAVLRRGAFGFELRAHADGAEWAGGDLFDDLLATRVLADLGHEVEPVALAKLRVACRAAKERLSTELAVTVPAPAKSPRGTVMVNRTDLEELIRPAVETTVAALQRTIQTAGTTTGTLQAVVLVGGCGRIPLISELVSAGVRVRVTAAADPELSVARGAALAAARVAKPTVKSPALAHEAKPVARSGAAHTDLMRLDDLPEMEEVDIGPPPPRPPVEIPPLDPPKRNLMNLNPLRRRDEDPLDDAADEDTPVRAPRRDYDIRPRRKPELSGEDLFTPLDDSTPDLFTHTPDPSDDHLEPAREDRRPVRSGPAREAQPNPRDDSFADLHGDPPREARRKPRDDSFADLRRDPPRKPRDDSFADLRRDPSRDPDHDSFADLRPEPPREIRPEPDSFPGSRPEPAHEVRPTRRGDYFSGLRREPPPEVQPVPRDDLPAEPRRQARPESRRDPSREPRRTADHDSFADLRPEPTREPHDEPRSDLPRRPRREARQDSFTDLRPEPVDEPRSDLPRRPQREAQQDSFTDLRPEPTREPVDQPRSGLPRRPRREARQDSYADLRRDRPRETRPEPHHESRHEARPNPRHDSFADPRHEVRAEPRHELPPEPRHESRSDLRPEPRQHSRSDAQPTRESRHDFRPERREPRRESPQETRPEPRRESRHENRRENRHEARPASYRETRPEPPESQRSRHERPYDRTPERPHDGGRRHRSDDRAFNETLTRARHATGAHAADGDHEDRR
jgi:actin-like ATPase involved in cell morphogenesis